MDAASWSNSEKSEKACAATYRSFCDTAFTDTWVEVMTPSGTCVPGPCSFQVCTRAVCGFGKCLASIAVSHISQ